jgi:hypothetical protein
MESDGTLVKAKHRFGKTRGRLGKEGTPKRSTYMSWKKAKDQESDGRHDAKNQRQISFVISAKLIIDEENPKTWGGSSGSIAMTYVSISAPNTTVPADLGGICRGQRRRAS